MSRLSLLLICLCFAVFAPGARGEWVAKPVTALSSGPEDSAVVYGLVGHSEGKIGFLSKVSAAREFLVWDPCAQAAAPMFDISPLTSPNYYGAYSLTDEILVFDGNVRDVWSTNGTPTGTSRVSDNFRAPLGMYAIGEMVLYVQRIENREHGLFVYDGDFVNDALVYTFDAPFASSFGYGLLGGVLGDRVIITMLSDTTGEEFFVSDGTVEGTVPVLASDPGGSVMGDASQMAVGDGVAYLFTVATEGPRAIWATDGTAAGTRLVHEFSAPFAVVRDMRCVGSSVFFNVQTDSADGWDPWYSNGTDAGTIPVADLMQQNTNSLLTFVPFAGGALFVANTIDEGRELWFSNGTSAGTQRITMLAPGVAPSLVSDAVVVGNVAYFVGQGSGGTVGLWSTDGTPEGTQLVLGEMPGLTSFGGQLVVNGGSLYFPGQSESGFELWTAFFDEDEDGMPDELATFCDALEDGIHSTDQDGDFVISLSEVLRVIQFYNSGGLHCAEGVGDSEDGYLAGPGANTSCAPHDTDYNPQNWMISLPEILRVIQFYNTGGYSHCPDAGTEDGYCVGPE